MLGLLIFFLTKRWSFFPGSCCSSCLLSILITTPQTNNWPWPCWIRDENALSSPKKYDELQSKCTGCNTRHGIYKNAWWQFRMSKWIKARHCKNDAICFGIQMAVCLTIESLFIITQLLTAKVVSRGYVGTNCSNISLLVPSNGSGFCMVEEFPASCWIIHWGFHVTCVLLSFPAHCECTWIESTSNFPGMFHNSVHIYCIQLCDLYQNYWNNELCRVSYQLTFIICFMPFYGLEKGGQELEEYTSCEINVLDVFLNKSFHVNISISGSLNKTTKVEKHIKLDRTALWAALLVTVELFSQTAYIQRLPLQSHLSDKRMPFCRRQWQKRDHKLNQMMWCWQSIW